MLFSPRFIIYIYGSLHYFFSLIFYPHLMHKLSLDISQCYRSAQLGQELRHHLLKIQHQYPNYIREVQGRGLFNAVELNSKNLCPISAYDICLQLKERVLPKPTHDTIIRLTPPLSISLDELQEASKALSDVLEDDLPKMQKAKPEHLSPTSSNICDRCIE